MYYFVNDHLGTPQKIIDSTNQVVWAAAYLPFGKAQVKPETITNNLRFPGQYFDSESGLHYNWHRYYDPDTGRYLTPDPVGLSGGINLYAYVNGNPMMFIDFMGLKVYKCFFKADVPCNDSLGLPHIWLKTDSKEAGLGQAGGGVPGEHGRCEDVCYISQTAITDHTGRSEKGGSVCVEIPDVSEDCVNEKLAIGKPQGRWTLLNQCWNFVERVLEQCRHRCLH